MKKNNGFSVLSLLFVLMLLIGTFIVVIPGNITADQDGDFIYSVSGEPLVAIITGYSGVGGEIVIPSTLGGYSVRAIEDNAFAHCTSLTSITIPDSVNSIGRRAFLGCSNLTSISIPENITSIGVYTFSGCTNLTSINIPNNCTSLGTQAFSFCTSLTSLNIPEGVTSIGAYAFWFCTSLTSLDIPDSVTYLCSNAFWSCTSLTSITIGNGITLIGEMQFLNCNNLTSLIIPEGVTYIGKEAFAYCTSLTTIMIPDNVTSLEDGLFHECTSLTSISLGTGISSIGSRVFFNCTNLKSINFLGFNVPTAVDINWIGNTTDGLEGHAYADSNFPFPGSTFYGLIMGANLVPVVPCAPTNLLINASDAQVVLSWVPPLENGGGNIDYYLIYQDGIEVVNTSLTMSTITGLVNGQNYLFTVKAHNIAGLSNASNEVSSVPYTYPEVPIGLTAIAANAQVTISWTTPDDGGSEISGYRLYRSSTESGTYTLIATPSIASYIDTDLVSGQTYWYKVSAVNEKGEGTLCSALSITLSESDSDGSSNDNLMLILGGAIIVVFLLIGAIFLIIRRRNV